MNVFESQSIEVQAINSRMIIPANKRKNTDQLYSTYVRKKRIKTITYLKKWSKQQNAAYIRCLFEFREELEDIKKRRQAKVFKQMSNILTNRSSQQCRGHHKKLMEKYKSIDKIIQYFGVFDQYQCTIMSEKGLTQNTIGQPNSEYFNSFDELFIQNETPIKEERIKEEWETFITL